MVDTVVCVIVKKKAIFREEATSALAGFHAGSLSRSKLDFGMLVFRREENQRTQRKKLRAKMRINNKLNPHMTMGPGIEPGTDWWDVNALTTVPSLLPYRL